MTHSGTITTTNFTLVPWFTSSQCLISQEQSETITKAISHYKTLYGKQLILRKSKSFRSLFILWSDTYFIIVFYAIWSRGIKDSLLLWENNHILCAIYMTECWFSLHQSKTFFTLDLSNWKFYFLSLAESISCDFSRQDPLTFQKDDMLQKIV